MKGRKTRKAGMPTVEGLHASFDKIAEKVTSMIEKGATDSKLLNCIRNAWMEQFHMELSVPAVKGMIMHYRAVNGPKSGAKRKTRKAQRGGMAPIDYTMGQGITDNVYGRFPVEIGTTPQVIKALDLGRFYESTGGRGCNATGGHAAPASAGMSGGGLFDAVAQGHAPASVPRNFIETGVSAVQGAPIMNPGANPISATVGLAAYAPKPYDPGSISPITSLAPVFKGY
jgi:hypothetical protein